MKRLLSVFVFFFLHFSLYSQLIEHWDIIYSQPFGSPIFYDESHWGFLDAGTSSWVNPSGATTLFLTEDGGKTYRVAFRSTPKDTHQLNFLNWKYITDKIIYIFADSTYLKGYDGLNPIYRYKTYIFKTTDGGYNWERIEFNTKWRTRFTSALQMVDSVNGILVQLPSDDEPDEKTDQIYITNDGWKTWQKINTHPEQLATFDVAYSPPNRIVTVSLGYKLIFTSDDLGKTWVKRRIPDSLGTPWNSNFFVVNDTICLMFSNTKLYRTTNAGLTWELLKQAEKSPFLWLSLIENDSTYIIITDDYNFRTTDYGRNWKPVCYAYFYHNNYKNMLRVSKIFNDSNIIAGSVSVLLRYTGKKNLKPPDFIEPKPHYKLPLDFTIKWTPIVGAEKYELQIVEREGHNLEDPELAPPKNFDTTLFVHKFFDSSAISYTLTGTNYFKEYLCRIRAINSQYTSEWSSDFWVTDKATEVEPKETEKIGHLTILPNPAMDYIEINFDDFNLTEAKELKIYNTLGECVMIIGAIQEFPLQPIDVSHLPAGVYFIRNGTATGMFVKM